MDRGEGIQPDLAGPREGEGVGKKPRLRNPGAGAGDEARAFVSQCDPVHPV